MELYGRKVIYTNVDEIDNSNIVEVLNDALKVHKDNKEAIQYLENYYRGKQAIENKVKLTREEINHKITENRAKEIVDFRTAYNCSEAVQYAGTDGDEATTNAVAKLNKMMNAKGKVALDRSMFEWDMICGTAYRYAEQADGDIPFNIYTLEPYQAFVVYSSGISKKPMLGVYCGVDEDGEDMYTAYTETMQFKIKDDKVIEANSYPFGIIPIIEYPANFFRLGAFEPVISVLDEINNCQSDRADAIQNFVQSLLVFYNCDLGEDENGNAITPEFIRAAGAIFLRTTGEQKAELKEIASQLDQTQTQVYKEDLWQSTLEIVGMPSQSDGSSSDSSNNGSTFLKNGWQSAEAVAKNSDIMFDASETKFLELILRICADLSDINLNTMQIEVKHPRRNFENMLSKVQMLIMMLSNDKVHPQVAYQIANLLADNENAYKMGIEWFESQKAVVESVEEDTEETEDEENEDFGLARGEKEADDDEYDEVIRG